MGTHSIDHDTIPCPPPDDGGPESGERSRTSLRVPIRSSTPPPHLAQMIEEELRERLVGIHCSEHDRPAMAELLITDDGRVQIVPMGCCDRVNGLVLAALRESVTLPPPCDPDLPRACETAEDCVRADAAADDAQAPHYPVDVVRR